LGIKPFVPILPEHAEVHMDKWLKNIPIQWQPMEFVLCTQHIQEKWDHMEHRGGL
jgi:hypothetical protein